MLEFADLLKRSGLNHSEAADELGVCEKTVRRYETGETRARARDLAVLKSLIIVRRNNVPLSPSKFHFIDLFAGIGGLRLGFEEIGGKCVFTSEWDKYAQKTYRANFPMDEHDIFGDIRNIKATDIPQHDVLLAGFPCQPFSIAGVSKKNALNLPHGFACDTQGTLFFEVQRIIAHHKPKVFLLENVKNLVSHDKGRTFATIRHVLEDELGYNIKFKIIDAEGMVTGTSGANFHRWFQG